LRSTKPIDCTQPAPIWFKAYLDLLANYHFSDIYSGRRSTCSRQNVSMETSRILTTGGVSLAALAGIYFVYSEGDTSHRDSPMLSAGRVAATAPAKTGSGPASVTSNPALNPSLDPSAATPSPVPTQLVSASTPAAALDAARPNDCVVEPSQIVKVNSGVEGVIEAIFVERGDNVARGEVVARLRSDVDQANAASALARASNAHTTRAAASRAAYLQSVSGRYQQVRQYVARDKVEEAQANARAAAEERNSAAQQQAVARLEYVQSQRILAEKTVRSPVSGIVTARDMAPGEYRGSQNPSILTIAQVNPLNVEVFAPISELYKVHVGDLVPVTLEAPVGGTYQARVVVIDRVFDAASGTFGMRLQLQNPGNRLPAGLRCRIDIAAKSGSGA
jgi:RND family efflux transporter MFP subunit